MRVGSSLGSYPRACAQVLVERTVQKNSFKRSSHFGGYVLEAFPLVGPYGIWHRRSCLQARMETCACVACTHQAAGPATRGPVSTSPASSQLGLALRLPRRLRHPVQPPALSAAPRTCRSLPSGPLRSHCDPFEPKSHNIPLSTLIQVLVPSLEYFPPLWRILQSFLRFYSVFRERGREEGRREKKHQCAREASIGCLSQAPTRD